MAKLILVVEDNKDNSDLVDKILKHYGYDVKIIESSKEALEFCKSSPPPALILMDVSLPEMDGLELTKLIKQIPRYSQTPIVAVTAYSEKEMEEKALKAGCAGMLAKPFDPNELIKHLEQYITS